MEQFLIAVDARLADLVLVGLLADIITHVRIITFFRADAKAVFLLVQNASNNQ